MFRLPPSPCFGLIAAGQFRCLASEVGICLVLLMLFKGCNQCWVRACVGVHRREISAGSWRSQETPHIC